MLTIIKIDEQPNLENKFFYGETVRYKLTGTLYTICDISQADEGLYGMWKLGTTCAVPTHAAHEDDLESISEQM